MDKLANETHCTEEEIMRMLVPILKDEFVATFYAKETSCVLHLMNGQEFQISVSQK